MTQTTAEARPYDPASVSNLSFWAMSAEEREVTFKELRDNRPLSWHRPLEGSLMMPELPGVWLVTRHEDVSTVNRDWETFSSAQGALAEAIPQEVMEASGSFLEMDPPRHTRLRRLVSSAFTPKQVSKISARIQEQATRIVDELLDVGDCDFVEQVSKRLPMWTIYEMLGLPVERRDAGAHAADSVVAWADIAVADGREPGQVIADALQTQLGLAYELIAERRAKPADDLTTALIEAEVDGSRLTDQEIAAFMNLLAVAGNDTTRNVTSFATKALCDFPDQRALLTKDFDNNIHTAVEEFIRWTTPVMTFRRTVTRETELHGQVLSPGDWVVMSFSSANRDERVFKDPYAFDILRDPNPHMSFGGGGIHFCLGNVLARTQLRALMRELLLRAPNLEVGEPSYLTSNFVRGIKSMPCSVGKPA
jgi:cytochrome P450